MRKIGGRKLIVVFVLGLSGLVSSQLWGSSFFSASESVQTESVDTLHLGGSKEETPQLLEQPPDSLAAVVIEEEKESLEPSDATVSKNETQEATASTVQQKLVEQAEGVTRQEERTSVSKTPGSSGLNSSDTNNESTVHNNTDGHHDDAFTHYKATQEKENSSDDISSSDHTHDHNSSEEETKHHDTDHSSDDDDSDHSGSNHNDGDTSATHDKGHEANDQKDQGHDDQDHSKHEASGAQNHAASVALIKKSTVRNRAEDNSPYKDLPSSELYNKSDLYGSAQDYLVGSGQYNGPKWFPSGYFPNNGAGTFRANCEVSHFSYDDPIVFPGKPEAAHLHMFLGNTNTNAYSTYDTLLNSGGSTCNGGELNRTAYWVPAMFDGKENVVVPSKVLFYYKTENPNGIGKVQQYPENLQLVGDTKNNIQDNLGLSTFRCNTIYNGAKAQPSATIPACPSEPYGQPGALEYMIFYDYCWNGDKSTINDWEANRDKNFAAPINYWHSSVCPASHPVLLPALVTHIFYDIKPGDDTSKWFLSSDVDADSRVRTAPGGSTAHADWFGAWNKQINAEWINNCSNTLNAECASGLLADPKGNPNSDVRALRLRNDFVTGYNSPKARIPVKDIYDQMCSQSDAKPYSSDQGGALAAYCKPEAHKH